MSTISEESSQPLTSDVRANFNSLLIQEVRKYPILYERRNHRDIEGVRSTWQAIGISLSAPAKLCETRWTSLRQTYSRKCQNLFHSSRESTQVKWQWYHEMEFVRPFILPRKRIKSSARYENGEEEDGDFSDGAAFVPHEDTGPNVYQQAEYSNGACPDPLVLMESHMETTCTTPETSIQDSNEMGTNVRAEREGGRAGCEVCNRHSCGNCTEWDVTGKLVSATLKRLKQRNARLLKIKILRLICEADELEILLENQT